MPLICAPASIFGGQLRSRSTIESSVDRGLAQIRSSPRPLPARPDPSVPPSASVDEQLIEILDAPVAPGETASIGYRRKEEAIAAVLATLSALESRALLVRLTAARDGDRLVEKLARLTAERRHRLLSFLADARRREAIRLARR